MEYRKTSAPYSQLRIEQREDGEPLAFSGYAAVFYNKDVPGTEYRFGFANEVTERIMPGAFTSAIKDDDVRGLVNHDPDNLLGRTTAGTMELSVDKQGLRYRIPYDGSDPDHVRTAAKVRRGDLNGSSFGFEIRDQEARRDDDGNVVIEVRDVKLYDVGPVTFPAYEATEAALRASGDESKAKEVYEALCAAEAAEGWEEKLRPLVDITNRWQKMAGVATT